MTGRLLRDGNERRGEHSTLNADSIRAAKSPRTHRVFTANAGAEDYGVVLTAPSAADGLFKGTLALPSRDELGAIAPRGDLGSSQGAPRGSNGSCDRFVFSRGKNSRRGK